MIKAVIQPIQPDDLSEALDVLAKAFATQPSSFAIYKGRTQSEIERRIQITFGALIKYLPGRVFVAKYDSRIVGAMRNVEWPGCQIKPLQIMRVLPAFVKTGGLGEMRRAMKWRGTWAKKDPKKPHWHLDPIGVTPDLQGQGIGSQMMEYYCNYVDKLGMAAYHETDRPENIKFYERFGFQVIGEEMIIDFPNWYMWRPPRQETT